MPSLGLASPVAAALMLLPAACFAALGLLGSAPGEWGQGALLAWICLVTGLIAGASLQVAPGSLPWLVPLIGFAAIMTGGPPGLLLAALAACLLLVPGIGPSLPLWLPIGLAALPGLVAVRRLLG